MAPTYLSPGVYVEEVDGGSKPIALDIDSGNSRGSWRHNGAIA